MDCKDQFPSGFDYGGGPAHCATLAEKGDGVPAARSSSEPRPVSISLDGALKRMKQARNPPPSAFGVPDGRDGASDDVLGTFGRSAPWPPQAQNHATAAADVAIPNVDHHAAVVQAIISAEQWSRVLFKAEETLPGLPLERKAFLANPLVLKMGIG